MKVCRIFCQMSRCHHHHATLALKLRTNANRTVRSDQKFFFHIFSKIGSTLVQKCNIIFRETHLSTPTLSATPTSLSMAPFFWDQFYVRKKSGHSGERRSQVRWNSESGTTTVLWQKTMAAAVAIAPAL